jgi:hypothetical protein
VLLWDAASFEGGMSFWWESVGIESYEGVFRAMSFEGMVECEKSRKVSGVRYECCPGYFILVFLIIYHVFSFSFTSF